MLGDMVIGCDDRVAIGMSEGVIGGVRGCDRGC